MIYKILLIKNRINEKLNLSKGIEYFKNTPLKIITEEISTDFDVTEKLVYNNTYKGAVCGDDIYPKLRAIVPEGKYNCVAFIYGNDLNEIRVYGYASPEPLYKGTDLVQLYKINDKGRVFNHEIFHAFFHKLHRNGINLDDPMDTYFNDKDLNANPSNRTMATERLLPYWATVVAISPVVTSNRVYITRQGYYDGVQTLGSLNTNGFSCKTLERPWKNNLPNISSIPTGVYNCLWTFSPRLLRFTYEIQNVVGRSGIRIHAGNFFFNIAGCILLGDSFSDINSDGKLDVLNSKATIKSFEEKMERKPFTLEIK